MKKEQRTLSGLQKKNIYIVPDNSFEELENEILRTKNQQPINLYYDRVLQYIELAAAACVILFIMSSGIREKKDNNYAQVNTPMASAINGLCVYMIDYSPPE